VGLPGHVWMLSLWPPIRLLQALRYPALPVVILPWHPQPSDRSRRGPGRVHAPRVVPGPARRCELPRWQRRLSGHSPGTEPGTMKLGTRSESAAHPVMYANDLGWGRGLAHSSQCRGRGLESRHCHLVKPRATIDLRGFFHPGCEVVSAWLTPPSAPQLFHFLAAPGERGPPGRRSCLFGLPFPLSLGALRKMGVFRVSI